MNAGVTVPSFHNSRQENKTKESSEILQGKFVRLDRQQMRCYIFMCIGCNLLNSVGCDLYAVCIANLPLH
jgi:hypothetical protein